MRRYINKIDQDALHADMNNINWNDEVCNDNLDLDICTGNLIDNLHKLCNKHAPITKCSKRKLKYCNKPWIYKELLELIKHKNNLFRKKKNYPCDFNNCEFSKMRNKVNHETRKKKKLYYSKYFNQYRNNSKKHGKEYIVPWK